jgi:hypothetical protein
MAQKLPVDDLEAPASLEVDQDLEFQHREWTAQRIGWLVMAALVILALAGLTGAGPLATAEERGASEALRVEYSRFERVQAPTDLQIELATNGADPVQLWIANEYLDGIELQYISPNPVETRAETDRQLFDFAAVEGASTIPISIQFRPKVAGSLSGTIGIPEGEEVSFRQFVYP